MVEPGAAWTRALEWIAVVPRLLFGALFTMTGVGWFRRADPAAYLADAVSAAPGVVAPDGFYDTFLATVVLADPGLFATLVGLGELLVGVTLLVGYPPRLGALGGVFLAVNYGLAFGNRMVPPGGNFLLAALLLALASRWPYARLVWRGPAIGSRVSRRGAHTKEPLPPQE